MRNNLVVAGLIVLSSGLLRAQFSVRSGAPAAPSGTLTMDDLLTAAKHYFRDTAEFPMVQTTTLSVTDASGRRSKPKVQTTSYLFQGYSRQANGPQVNITGHVSMWARLHGSKMMWVAANSAFWTSIPGIALYATPNTYTLQVRAISEHRIAATLIPVRSCSFSMNERNSRWYFPDDLCGRSQFQLGDKLAFQRFSYEVPGLPASVRLDPFGRCTLRRYHTDMSFQSVNLPGEDEPFLVPKQVTATLETDKGTIVISSSYRPKPALTK
jgi:hypothetical protein